MAEAASGGTALTPAPPCRAGGPGTTDVIDADTIWRTCNAVLWATSSAYGAERQMVGALLRGHVQLLVPELTAAAPRLRGAWRDAADHVLASTRRLLTAAAGTSDDDLYGLATQCRALLTLRRQAAPLTCLAALITESRS